MKSVDVRQQLVEALRLDLVGPGEVIGHAAYTLCDANEILPQRPSSWYLTGFLVPSEADPDQKCDEQSADELDGADNNSGGDDAVVPEPAAARVRFLPSSIGASLLVPENSHELRVVVRWGDYTARKARPNEPGPFVWQRTPREEVIPISLPGKPAFPRRSHRPCHFRTGIKHRIQSRYGRRCPRPICLSRRVGLDRWLRGLSRTTGNSISSHGPRVTFSPQTSGLGVTVLDSRGGLRVTFLSCELFF